MRCFEQVTGVKPRDAAQYKPPYAAGCSGVAERTWRASLSNRSRKNSGYCGSQRSRYASGVFSASLERQDPLKFIFVEKKRNP